MDRQRIEGGLKKATGTIKEQAGKALGDRHLEAEGKVEKAEGRIRSGVAPQAMAALRNLIVAVLQRHGMSNRAAALRQFAWHPDQAAQALGLACPSWVAAARVA